MDDPTKEVRQLAYDFLSPAAKAIGSIVGDELKFLYAPRRLRKMREVMELGREELRKLGLEPQPVAERILIPTLENASLLEDDEQDLTQRWARLLASASADHTSVHPSFPEVLKQLTSEDARALDVLRGFGGWKCPPIDDVRRATGLAPSRFTLVLDTLFQLGLIQHGVDRRQVQPGQAFYGSHRADEPAIFEAPQWSIHRATHIRLTARGAQFVDACRGPHAATGAT